MKLTLVAMIITMLFTLQSAFANAESADQIAASLLDANEPAAETIQIPEMETALEESIPASLEEDRVPAAATEEIMFTEAPGSIDFDMATIFMIEDAPSAPKNDFTKVANGN